METARVARHLVGSHCYVICHFNWSLLGVLAALNLVGMVLLYFASTAGISLLFLWLSSVANTAGVVLHPLFTGLIC
jgi:uncharacterized membrane protein YuzA (DUF378 family)